MTKKVNIDWNNLGFEYIKTDFRYISNWKDGKWDDGHLTEDNMLKITNEGRQLALDQRLMNDMIEDNENSKVSTCANNIYKLWEQNKEEKLKNKEKKKIIHLNCKLLNL